MPTEDRSTYRSHQGLPQGEGVELSLDELAKGLATGTLSRGKALRLMGAALVGGALASIPGIALAKPKPEGAKCNHNHQCASGQCVELPERGVRVCAAAGPICPPGCPGLPQCACDTDLITGDPVCISPVVALRPGDCTACLEGEVCVEGGLPGFVGCSPPCP
jgi:hypothetical protein